MRTLFSRRLPALGVAAVLAATLTAGLVHADAAPGSVLTGTSAPPNGVPGQDRTYSLTFGGLSRSYLLYVPPHLGTRPARLVVALHHLGDTSAGTEALMNFDAGAAKNRVLVVYPQGISGSWDAGTCCGAAVTQHVDDVGFLDAVITDVAHHVPVDLGKIAMGGFSNGAMMTYRYLCERSARVHVVFPASGVPVMGSCSFSRPVNVLHMHGMLDTTVPWNGTRTSPLTTDGILPSVPSSAGGMAYFAGCQGFSTSVLPTGATRYQAQNCPPGSSVDLLSSPNLDHRWVTGSAATTYHLDETNTAWSFILTH